MALRDWLCASDPIAIATPATFATNQTTMTENLARVADVAVAKPLSSKPTEPVSRLIETACGARAY